MEWENKVKMAQLGNRRNESNESKKEFQDFVINNISSFDDQSWDMFANLVDIISDEMIKDIDFWKQIYTHIKNVVPNNVSLHFRTAMRLALIDTVCEEKLGLK